MYILGIETSCDETAASVVKDGREILSNVVVSQIDIFKEYGGVIPEVAARNHLEVMLPVVNKALKDADLAWDEIDAIAVTHTPGLLGSLPQSCAFYVYAYEISVRVERSQRYRVLSFAASESMNS